MPNLEWGEATQGLVLNVYKEIPWTSHDAVARVRRILGIKQVGHAGSLDPFACGVLVVCAGRATKLLPHLVDLGKGYRGTLRFGRRSASGDLDGELVEEGAVPSIDLGALQAATRPFVGRISQIPPMVSALKVQGQRLHDLARKGIEVERAPRLVDVHRFEITKLELPRAEFEIECGKGTYVRTLVEDLARSVGSLALVETLTRTHVGPFEVADACRLISAPCFEREGLLSRAIDMNTALGHLRAAKVESSWIRRVRQGGLPPRSALRFDYAPRQGERIRLIGPEGELLAIARWDLMPGPADLPIEAALSLELERVI